MGGRLIIRIHLQKNHSVATGKGNGMKNTVEDYPGRRITGGLKSRRRREAWKNF
jgi:hypothetical protein